MSQRFKLYNSLYFSYPKGEELLLIALRAIVSGNAGLCITGEAGVGKTILLERLIEEIPRANMVTLEVTKDIAPAEIPIVLSKANYQRWKLGGQSCVLLFVDDADRLRRDTLDLLNKIAALPLRNPLIFACLRYSRDST